MDNAASNCDQGQRQTRSPSTPGEQHYQLLVKGVIDERSNFATASTGLRVVGRGWIEGANRQPQFERNKKQRRESTFPNSFLLVCLRSANLTFAAETKTGKSHADRTCSGQPCWSLESGVWKRRRLALCWRDASKVWRCGGVALNWNDQPSKRLIDNAKKGKMLPLEDRKRGR